MVEATLAQENLGELHGRLSRCFARVEPLQQARKYVTGLMSALPRKNSWTLAEHAGDRTPDRMQRLLNDAVWDTTAAMGVVRGFVAEHLAPPAGGLAVAALDETGQQKKRIYRGPQLGRCRSGARNGVAPAAPRGASDGLPAHDMRSSEGRAAQHDVPGWGVSPARSIGR